jgi:hypothetical protein
MAKLKADACNFGWRYSRLARYPEVLAFDRIDNLDLEPTGVLFGSMNRQHIHGTVEHARCDRVPPKLTAGRCTHWHLKP